MELVYCFSRFSSVREELSSSRHSIQHPFANFELTTTRRYIYSILKIKGLYKYKSIPHRLGNNVDEPKVSECIPQHHLKAKEQGIHYVTSCTEMRTHLHLIVDRASKQLAMSVKAGGITLST